jgi:hypothetical protein
MPEPDKNTESGPMFEHSNCLTVEQLTAYAGERTSSEERFVIEKHLVDCELCSDALDGFTMLREESGLQDQIKSLNSEISKNSSRYFARRRSRKIYYSLAAAILVAITSALYFRAQRPSYEPLFAEYFKPYPNMIPIARGEEPSSLLESAMVEYENANYSEALKILKTLTAGKSKSDTASFYAGVSSLCINDPHSAIIYLQNVSEQSGLTDQTAWYIGLACLQQNEAGAAKEQFSKLSSRDGIFRQRSIDILDRLK